MLKNGLYNLISALIRNGFNIISIPILIRLVGLETYGLWILVTSFIAIVGLAEAGLSVATTVFIARDLGNEDQEGILQTITFTFGGMLILATLASGMLWISSPSLVNLFPKLDTKDYELAIKAWQLGSIVVWARLLQQVLVGISQAYQQYKIINLINTIQVFISNIALLGIAWLGQDIATMMVSQAIISVLILLFYAGDAWRLILPLRPRFIWSTQKAQAIFQYSFMTWLISIGTTAFGQGDRLIVGAILGTKTLGLYSSITTVASQINSLSAIAVQPLLPTLSNLKTKKNDSKTIENTVKKSLQLNFNVACVVAFAIILLSPLILKLIVGSSQIDFKTSVLSLQVISLIYTLYSINASGYYILFSLGELKILFLVISIGSILSLTLISIGAKYYGLFGACIGNGGYLVLLFLTFNGMDKMSIPNKIWISFISKNLTYFTITSLATIFLSFYLNSS
jgi:hypothetical protein